MKPLLFILLALPLFAGAQCPDLIGKPYVNAIAFKSEVEKATGFSFPDSIIQGEHEVIIYQSQTAKFKVFNVRNSDLVKSIVITGPTEQIIQFANAFQDKYKECRVTHGDQWALFKGCKMVWKKTGQSSSEFFLTKE